MSTTTNQPTQPNAPRQTVTSTISNHGPLLTNIFIILSILLFSVAIGIMSFFLGNADQYKSFKEKLPQIFFPAIFGSIALFIASYFYFQQKISDPSLIYYVLGLVCLSICASFSALALSVLKKSS
jgi:hypothetical protein